MAYFEDLSQYKYRRDLGRMNAFNIGWLSEDRAFPKAPPDRTLLDSLAQIDEFSVRHMRGVHECELCESLLRPTGNGEFWVEHEDGRVFVAPTLIGHYIDAHQYCPPPAFVEAVLRCANWDERAYETWLESYLGEPTPHRLQRERVERKIAAHRKKQARK